jgi:hypothetical protein
MNLDPDTLLPLLGGLGMNQGVRATREKQGGERYRDESFHVTSK